MKIAIAGYGQEGKANYEYWHVSGNELTIADERDTLTDLPEDARTILGTDAFSKLSDFDLIIRTPSVNPSKLPYDGKVWSGTNEFFKECPAEIIGVTGTKGKGTTSSLITSILQAAGKTVHLVGNIGTPALAELPKISENDIVVFELSSFQLWDLQKSPHIAVVLAIEPDHLDVHADMTDYVLAKSNIINSQTPDDVVVYNSASQIATSVAVASNGQKHSYQDEVVIEGKHFQVAGSNAAPLSVLKLPGQHNVENAKAAIMATWQYTQDAKSYETGLASFDGLKHRIKLVSQKAGVSFYDDSYSSAPSATIAAMRSFDAPEIVLVGGYDKGADFSELATYVKQAQNMKKLIVYGQTKTRIQAALEAVGVDSEKYAMLQSTDFSEIVSYASSQASEGDVVILSPACASFDMFKNFTERGERFIELVS